MGKDSNTTFQDEVFSQGFFDALHEGLDSGLTPSQVVAVVMLTKETRIIANRFSSETLRERVCSFVRVMQGDEI